MTRIEPLAEAHLPRLRALFDASSSTCFCRYWHFVGTKNDWLDRCANQPEENAAELEAAVRAGSAEARGLVAVDDDGAIVGWMKLTPRDAVPKLRALPVYRSLDLGDGGTTFSVGCFLVRPDARGKGVARALLAAAPRFAREWGARALEAYPRRSSEPLHAEEAWQGPERVFVDAGFEPVVDVPPYPVYRKAL
ncbi:MAG: GNAT family N-acetyltransferase [Labilithrix sp.]|nr:GNAT family N-acetyltransferase [Labilithrix sp.]